MKTFLFFKEEIETAPNEENSDKPVNPLQNPGMMFNDYNSALKLAQRLATTNVYATYRAYIIKYKYYKEKNQKPFLVVPNNILVKQEPNWEAKGYDIQGWVSAIDGVVSKTEDGKYVKGQQ